MFKSSKKKNHLQVMSGTVQNLYEICCCYCTSVCLDFTESWKCRLILRIVYNVDDISRCAMHAAYSPKRQQTSVGSYRKGWEKERQRERGRSV